MKHYALYNLQTGALTGRTFSSTVEENVELNIPEGHGVKEGNYDHLSQRVDITHPNHPVVDWQPPQPSEDHEWKPEAKRWLLKPEVMRSRLKVQEAKDKISTAEGGSIRAMRELLLELFKDAAMTPALQRLRTVDEEIAEHRKDIQS